MPVMIPDTCNVAVDDAGEVLDTHSLETRGHPSLPGSQDIYQELGTKPRLP